MASHNLVLKLRFSQRAHFQANSNFLVERSKLRLDSVVTDISGRVVALRPLYDERTATTCAETVTIGDINFKDQKKILVWNGETIDGKPYDPTGATIQVKVLCFR